MPGENFKDAIDLALTERLARSVSAVFGAFNAVSFRAMVAAELDALPLKGRVALLARALHAHLPPYPEAVGILLATLPPPLPEAEGMFSDAWIIWPLADFVQLYGLEHPERSLAAMEQITQRATAEFAIRPYLVRHPTLTLATLHRWVDHESFHVRRLVSEGTRPRLPWGMRLGPFVQDPSPVFALLERLRDDPSPYVRRSVANNLNDIAKDHPARVVEVAARWLTDATPARRALVERGLRTLVKAGHPGALALVGGGGADWALTGLEGSAARLRVGESLVFSFTLENRDDQEATAVVDYIVDFARPRGQSRRVFKLRKVVVPAGGAVDLRKAHSFRDVSIRSHHPGPHAVHVQVNGQVLGSLALELLPA